MAAIIPQAPNSLPDPNAQSQQQQAPRQQAPQIELLARLTGSQCEVTGAGKAYLDTMRAAFDSSNSGIKVTPRPNPTIGAAIVHKDGRGILLSFSETYSSGIPSTELTIARPLYEEIINSDKIKLIDNIVVNRADYEKVDLMVNHIKTIFLALDNEDIKNLVLSSFTGGSNPGFTVVTNINTVMEVVRQLNPHAAMPPCSIGFVLFVKARRKAPINGVQNQDDRELLPILAVTAHTRISARGASFGVQQPGIKPYIPSVVITGVFSGIKHPGLAAVALPLAADAFIRRGGWKAPYYRFGDTDPNLGALVHDSAGNPCRTKTVQDVESLIAQYLDNPWLSIDIPDGKARIPGLENVIYNSTTFATDIAAFLQLSNPEAIRGTVFCATPTKEYIGTVNKGDTDSRDVDYLQLVAAGHVDSSNNGNLFKLLHLPLDPTQRGRTIAEIGYDFKAEYCNHNAVINAHVVNTIADITLRALMPQWDNAYTCDNNLASFDPSMNAFASFAQPVTMGGYSIGNSPFQR